MNTNATMIFDGIASRDECFALINRYSPTMQTYEGSWLDNPHHALGFRAGQVFEISQEEYWYFLEVLPPLAMTSAGFAMSEFTMGNLTNAFFHIGGQFFCMTIAVNRDGAEAAVNRAGRAIQAMQSGTLTPTEALVKWAAFVALSNATPTADVGALAATCNAAEALMQPPESPTGGGTLRPGSVAFYEGGNAWRFSHKGSRTAPSQVWFHPPNSEAQERRDALNTAIAIVADVPMGGQ